jgi:selenocysteine-specific elongation factor
MIVATAGHVDHGKTSLVQQLTGVDTDRLEEEKRRGLSINLGFAYRQLDEHISIGFIDVPGHNRFINTMISGVSSIDMALLVIAADDGPMPQTVEHFEVLRLLGVSEFVVVITRIDRVDSSRLEEAVREAEELLDCSCPVFPVNNLDGTGIDRLQDYLEERARKTGQKLGHGYFRLAIDRAFLLKGTGLVVTGTAVSGTVNVGDQMHIMPRRLPVRVRGIHAQNEDAQTGRAGQRCALNIAGAELSQVQRGDWLQARELAQTSERLDVRLEVLSSIPYAIKHMLPVKVHIGAGRISAKLHILDRQRVGNALAPGVTAFAQLILQGEFSSCRGDRFLLRDDSESLTLGGGVVLDPLATKPTRLHQPRLNYLAAMANDSVELSLESLLFQEKRELDVAVFRQVWNLRVDECANILAQPPFKNQLKAFSVDGAVHIVALDNWLEREQVIIAWLYDWHRENPSEEAAPLKHLREDVLPGLKSDLFMAVMSDLIKRGQIRLANGRVSLAERVPSIPDVERRHWQIIETLLNEHGPRIPAVSDIQKQLPLDAHTIDQALRLAVKEGWALQLSARRYALSTTVRDLAHAVNELSRATPEFSVVEFKNHAGLGRNVAIELMEYFDAVHFTVRRGDNRSVIDSDLPDRKFGVV